MRDFLREQGIRVLDKEESQANPLLLADVDLFDVKERDDVVLSVLEEWFKRFQELQTVRRGSKIPHVVFPASPGIVLSRLQCLVP